ncbi:hypothetical protein [Micromonospora sp. NPDC085948]|uniref:hypothetical protein n=1 Tax=Micromonospora sp. NPDC085948 TaxID=3155293 RepID=UPI00342D9FF8
MTTTVPGGKPPDASNTPSSQDEPKVSKGRFGALHAISILVCAGAGAILAVVLLSAWQDLGPVANAAITAIGAITGAAIGVVGLEVQRKEK